MRVWYTRVEPIKWQTQHQNRVVRGRDEAMAALALQLRGVQVFTARTRVDETRLIRPTLECERTTAYLIGGGATEAALEAQTRKHSQWMPQLNRFLHELHGCRHLLHSARARR